MFAALWAVLEDLWLFVLGKEEGVVKHATQSFAPESTIRKDDHSDTNTPVKASGRVARIDVMQSPQGSQAYVIIDRTDILERPVVAFDAKVGVLNYGEVVYITNIEGSYAHTRSHVAEGWVHTSALTEDKHAVFPEFKPGHMYSYSNEDTIKVRRWSHDELFGEALKLPLQPSEYVLYELSMQNKKISWPRIRPRRAGRWHSILRGHPNVKIDIEPRTHSIIEYTTDDGRGVLGIVTIVAPDNTITVKSVGRMVDGECRLDVFKSSEWRELRPVFITVK